MEEYKKLELASNKIGDIGAIEIGKSMIWVNLEVLDLSGNEIGDEGARTLDGNNTWEKLTKLDYSSNKVTDKKTVIFVCSNGIWKDLEYLFLGYNPAVLEATDAIEAIEGITSKNLEELTLHNTEIKKALLQYLKNSATKSVIELSLAKGGFESLPCGYHWTQHNLD